MATAPRATVPAGASARDSIQSTAEARPSRFAGTSCCMSGNQSTLP